MSPTQLLMISRLMYVLEHCCLLNEVMLSVAKTSAFKMFSIQYLDTTANHIAITQLGLLHQ